MPQNQHYISRFLTSPWHIDGKRLRFYDFVTNSLHTRYSKSLFAEHDLHDQETEIWLTRHIETPLATVRRELEKKNTSVLDDRRCLNAVYLAVYLQHPRNCEANYGVQNHPDLAHFVAQSESALDAELAICYQKHTQLLALYPEGEELFFPSTGIFAIPLDDTGCRTGHTFGLVLPLTPRMAIAVTSDTATIRDDVLRALSNFSVGSPYAEKVVIPPQLERDLTDNQLHSTATSYRDWASHLLDTYQEKRDTVLSVCEGMGLPFSVDGADRLLY